MRILKPEESNGVGNHHRGGDGNRAEVHLFDGCEDRQFGFELRIRQDAGGVGENATFGYVERDSAIAMDEVYQPVVRWEAGVPGAVIESSADGKRA